MATSPGRGWPTTARTGEVCGVPLPEGLEDGSRLEQPIFTPATKAAVGDHDENVSYAAVAATVGEERAAELRDLTLAVYGRAEEIARERGIILADTKLEFGTRAGRHARPRRRGAHPGLLAVLAGGPWQPGRAQPSYDKQYVRDWLSSPEQRLGPPLRRGAAAAAGRGGRADPRQVRRGLRAADRREVLR